MEIPPKLYYKLTFIFLAILLAENSFASCFLVGSDVRKPFASRSACENELRMAIRTWRKLGESGDPGLSCSCQNSTTSSGPRYQRDYAAEQREAQKQAEREKRRRAEEENQRKAFNVDKQKTLNNLKSLDGGKIFDGSQSSSSGVVGLKSLDTKPKTNQGSNNTSGLKSLSVPEPSVPQLTARQETGDITKSCSAAIEASNDDLQQFVKTAEEKGYNFTKQEFNSNLKGLSEKNILQMTDREYASLYKTTKKNIKLFKTTRDYLKQLSDCAQRTQCDLLIMSQRLNKELYKWIKGMTSKDIRKATDRVKKASIFYTNYVESLIKSNQNNLAKAAQCL